jgi:cellobiose-specific phosphotransferase system component IIA
MRQVPQMIQGMRKTCLAALYILQREFDPGSNIALASHIQYLQLMLDRVQSFAHLLEVADFSEPAEFVAVLHRIAEVCGNLVHKGNRLLGSQPSAARVEWMKEAGDRLTSCLRELDEAHASVEMAGAALVSAHEQERQLQETETEERQAPQRTLTLLVDLSIDSTLAADLLAEVSACYSELSGGDELVIRDGKVPVLEEVPA